MENFFQTTYYNRVYQRSQDGNWFSDDALVQGSQLLDSLNHIYRMYIAFK